jgi:hypothetical protein
LAAALADFVQVILDFLDATANESSVGFQLGFAGSAGTDTTAQALQVRPLANQAGQ